MSRQTVLVVDDEASIADGLRLTLESEGLSVRLAGSDIAIEGSFELPQLARLAAEDQIFVVAFLRSHGSIKEMERIFGVSYPTIKSRLTRIAESLEFVESSAPAPFELPQAATAAKPNSSAYCATAAATSRARCPGSALIASRALSGASVPNVQAPFGLG